MAKIVAIPEFLPVSPLSLTCPGCRAKPGQDCHTLAGGFAAVHLARVKAAAAKDVATARRRQDVDQAAARIVREATERT